MSLESILLEIESRFILGCDEAQLRDKTMLFFKIQKAHWYYLDHYEHLIRTKKLPSLSLDKFGTLFIERSLLLSRYLPVSEKEEAFNEWRKYLRRIPRLGAIILSPNLDEVLMIQPWASKGWQFPRGKLNANETHVEAAAREVYEECGVDISHLIDETRFIEKKIDSTVHKLYIAYPLATNVAVSINCQKEIQDVQWKRIDELDLGDSKLFFGVAPFIDGIRKFIREKKGLSLSFSRKQSSSLLPAGSNRREELGDKMNKETFADEICNSWSFEEMLLANKKLQFTLNPTKILQAFTQTWNL